MDHEYWQQLARDMREASEGVYSTVEESLRFVGQFDFSPLNELLETSTNALNSLPARTREALLTMARHGWYVDPEMEYVFHEELADALDRGDQDVEPVVRAYFHKRASSIGEEIIAKVPNRARFFAQAFTAHARGDFSLSIPALLAQVDGMCFEKAGKYFFMRDGGKPQTGVYVDAVNDVFQKALLAPLGERLPINASKSERVGAWQGVFNRHEVLHGVSLDFDTEENSLRTISLANYVAYVLYKDVL